MAICERKLEPHHPSTLQARNSLAVAYDQRGEFVKAMALHDTNHAVLDKVPLKDALLITFKSNRALSYLHGGKEEQGLKLLGTAYEDARQKLGVRNDMTFTSGISYAHALLQTGKPKEAEVILVEAVNNSVMAKGELHPMSIIAQINLGQAMQAVGKYQKACSLLQKVVPVAERVLGAEHPNTLTALSVLGKLYEDLNRYGEAEKQLRKVWKIQQTRFGAEKLKTLTTENNLAVVLDRLNQFDEARSMLEHVAEQRHRQLGEDHPETLLSLNNLAGVLENLGQVDRARGMYETCYQMHAKKKGTTHPDTLRMLTNFANCCQRAGRFEEARRHYELARRDLLATLGPRNPDTFYAGHFLAENLRSMNLPGPSAQLYKEVLPIFKEVLGDDHQDTICTANNLAVVQSQLGQHEEAIVHLGWVIAQRTRLLGATHQETLDAQLNLARTYRQSNRLEEALRLYQNLHAPFEKQRGPDHSSVYRLIHETGLCYYQLKRYDEAVIVYQDLAQRKQRKLGNTHPETLYTQANLANNLLSTGKTAQAMTILESVYQYGRSHKDVQFFRESLLKCYTRLNETAKAEPVHVEAVAWYRQKYGLEDSRTVSAMESHAQCLAALQNWPEASIRWRECLALREKLKQPGYIGYVQIRLGLSMIGDNKALDAEPFLVKGCNALSQLSKEPSTTDAMRACRAEGIQELIKYYMVTGKKTEAEYWNKEADKK